MRRKMFNTFAAELFSEIEKSTPWNFVGSLTFRGSCGLNLAFNTIKLYTNRRRISCRFQKCNKKASKNFCIKSYGFLKLPRYFDPSTTSILVVGSEWVIQALWKIFMTSFGCFSLLDMTWSRFGPFLGFLKFSWGSVNTFAAELFSEIEKSTPWDFVGSLTFKGSCGLNLASNTIKLYTIRRRISCRFQKCKNFPKISVSKVMASWSYLGILTPLLRVYS